MPRSSESAGAPVFAVSSSSKPPSRRSVWGCLTCRRRKVKCQSRETPCEACRRLHLTCTPSFNSNFKQWKGRQPETPRPAAATPPAAPDPALASRGVPAREPPHQRQSPVVVSDSPDYEPRLAVVSSPSLASVVLTDSGHRGHGTHPQQSQQPAMAMQDSDIWPSPSPQIWDAGTPFLNDEYGGYSSPLFYPAAPPLPPYIPETDERYQYEDSDIPVINIVNNVQQEPLPRPPPSAAAYMYGFNFMGQEPAEPVPNMALITANNSFNNRGGEDIWRDQSSGHSSSSNNNNNQPWTSIHMNPRLDDDRSLVLYYKRNLASFFSVKSSESASWNFYSFAIRSSEHQPDSPLRHSILAWTSAHLILRNQASLGHTQYRHYARARADADDLRSELEHEAGHARSPQSMASLSKKLRMLLSTSLFLGYCDVMSGDSVALAHELANIKQLLASNWPRFQQALGPLEARILVWLAYLDLRSTLWTTTGPVLTDTSPGAMPASSEHTTAQSRPKSRQQQTPTASTKKRRVGLFQFLMSNAVFDKLRSNRGGGGIGIGGGHGGVGATNGDANEGGHYYLTECFGAALPQQELRNDLIQEPAKMLSDQIMAVVATLREFEAWDDDMQIQTSERTASEEGLVQELRVAKVQAIRANIARIQAEAKVVHADLLRASSGADHVVRTEFHRLVSMAMCLSAIILLNRIVAPDCRTDDESQAAARAIVRIARKLRESGYLCTPRSLVWPLPVFVAGIEVTDRIYQDWVLNYLLEVASWGTSTKKARELLRRIIERQEAQGKRVRVRDVIGEFGEVIMI